jgi:hypothetical protein
MKKLLTAALAFALAIVPALGQQLSTAPSLLSNFSATAAPTVSNDSSQGYATGSLWERSDTGELWRNRSAAVGAAAWVKLALSEFQGYIVNNWYIPHGVAGFSVGTAPGANSIRLAPFIIKQRVTISSLAVRVGTLSGSGNVQAAIYNADATLKRPTTFIDSTTLSTNATGVISNTLTANRQLEPGLYFYATNCDNGTAVFTSTTTTSTFIGQNFGDATQALTLGTGGNQIAGYSFAGTYNTWPDLTGQTLTGVSGSNIPVVIFKVASVP